MQTGISLPEPWRGTHLASFARYTIEVRIADIARRTRADLELSPDQAALFDQLLAELPDAQVRLLLDTAAPDTAAWQSYLSPYLGQSWLELPWFVSEVYFYRRLLEACGYFQPVSGYLRDPYIKQKQQGLLEAQEQISALCSRLDAAIRSRSGPDRADAETFFAAALWGNQADLSLWPAGTENQPGHSNARLAREHLLVDDFPRLWDHLFNHTGLSSRADFLIDNAGFELVCDLCLAVYLLSSRLVEEIRLHLKPHPFFVSDAMIKDVKETVVVLAKAGDLAVRGLAQLIQGYLDQGRLKLLEPWFWVSPLAAWEMGSDLWSDLSQSNLVVSKGDLNYRRLLGDRRWPYTASFQDITQYFPAPVLALRVLKSEVACGLSSTQIKNLEEKDPAWLTNGKWGLIQFRG